MLAHFYQFCTFLILSPNLPTSDAFKTWFDAKVLWIFILFCYKAQFLTVLMSTLSCAVFEAAKRVHSMIEILSQASWHKSSLDKVQLSVVKDDAKIPQQYLDSIIWDLWLIFQKFTHYKPSNELPKHFFRTSESIFPSILLKNYIQKILNLSTKNIMQLKSAKHTLSHSQKNTKVKVSH